MRVRLDWFQTDAILEALYGNHLCDECNYDDEMEVIKGTECEVQKLINKFERVKSGAASDGGREGGRTAQRNLLLGRSATRSELAYLKGGLSYYTDKVQSSASSTVE